MTINETALNETLNTLGLLATMISSNDNLIIFRILTGNGAAIGEVSFYRCAGTVKVDARRSTADKAGNKVLTQVIRAYRAAAK
jgi:hypothetical protein